MRRLLLLALVFKALVSYSQTSGLTNRENKAIICLTYDDALDSQLSIAIPQLDSTGLKGTFFLNSIQGTSGILGKGSPAFYGWRKAAQNGHELANHTLFHSCPEKFGWKKEEAIESYNVEKILKEIEVMNLYLEQIDQKTGQRSFAFPCNNVTVNGVDYSTKLKELHLINYARGGGDKLSVVADLDKMNMMQVPSWHVQEGTGLNDLIEFAEKVKAVNGLGVFQFHGIGGPLFKISSETHRGFLKYLKDHENDYLVSTFADAMAIIQKRVEMKLKKK
ncbi:polysaccharide deacetylase family protein [Chryseolinea sp. H1M3-3]|uniref:polysaccharide deacetylase family protein n=1 Tax=Chryseolinea sp. H1M3-3 TaxID=3034144 RepID=UPI0023EC2F3F|nr:polysaccharide deacetylase family protein [Chryseolinea sp. H1M3-3]